MPRKPKITAIPVEAPADEGLAKAWGDDEAKTDAQQMNDVINEIKVDDEPVVTNEPDEPPTPVAKPKARAKRAPKKPVVEPEPVEEPQESEPEVPEAKGEPPLQVEEPDDANWTKVESKVACPDCGKQMSAKTLRCSHGPNCPAKKQKQSEVDTSVFEQVIENEVQKRLHNSRAQRAVRRQEMVEKLMQNAF